MSGSYVARPIMSDSKFLDKAWSLQKKLDKKIAGITTGKYARVLKMARKPEPEEMRRTSTIVLAGIAVIGGIGFVVFLFMSWFLGVIGA